MIHNGEMTHLLTGDGFVRIRFCPFCGRKTGFVKCPVCNKLFSNGGDDGHVYCSTECRKKKWDLQHYKIICDICGKEHKTQKRKTKSGFRFCSRTCLSIFRKKQIGIKAKKIKTTGMKCSVCNTVKKYEDFYKVSGSLTPRNYCIPCSQKMSAKSRKKHRRKRNERNLNCYHVKVREKRLDSDKYIRDRLKFGTSLEDGDIPDELVELQRLNLKLKREKRGMINGNGNQDSKRLA
jgi:hypothetical protein